MIDIKVEKTGNAVDVMVGGELTILDTEELKKIFLDVLGTSQSVLVHLRGTEHIDLPALQLLCSAHKMALSLKKRFALHDNVPVVIRQTFISAGYSRHIGCSLDKDNTCLWVKERSNE